MRCGVLTDRDNLPGALATYRRAGATRESDAMMLEWDIDGRRRDRGYDGGRGVNGCSSSAPGRTTP